MGNTNPMQNQISNPKQNIQMIYAKMREPNIVVVTRGGVVTGEYQNTQHGQLQVRTATQKKVSLDVQKEKEAFLDVRLEFVKTNQPSTSGKVKAMPKRFEQLLSKQPMKKVSKLKYIFKSCLALIHDRDVVQELKSLIEETLEGPRPEKNVNHIGKILKLGREL